MTYYWFFVAVFMSAFSAYHIGNMRGWIKGFDDGLAGKANIKSWWTDLVMREYQKRNEKPTIRRVK